MEQFPKYFQKQGLGGEEDHQKFRTEGKRGRKTSFSVFEAHQLQSPCLKSQKIP